MIPVYCPLCCDQPFEGQEELFHHLKTLRNNLFCPICSERFSSFDSLVIHLSRKCNGPASPHEAKRKCLFGPRKLSDTVPITPLVSPSSLDQALGEVTVNSKMVVNQEARPGSMCNQGVAASAPPSVIPLEIINRLPKGVTVSQIPSNHVPPQQVCSPTESISSDTPLSALVDKNQSKSTTSVFSDTPLSALVDKNKSKSTSSVSSDTPSSALVDKNKSTSHSNENPSVNNNSLSQILNKVSLNPHVDISVKANSDIEGTSEKSDYTNKLPSVSIITSKEINSLPPQQRSRKPGPLSSKPKETKINESEYQDKQKKQLSLKEQSNSNLNPGSIEYKETKSKENVTSNLQSENIRDTPSRKRGRPRKYFDKVDDKHPIVNGSLDQEVSETSVKVGAKPTTQAKGGALLDKSEKESSKRPIRKSAKKFKSYNKLIDSDNSDHFEDVEHDSDGDYVPEEPLEKEEEDLETMPDERNNGQDAIVQDVSSKPDTKPEKRGNEVDAPNESASGEESKTEEEEEYTCSACNIRFTSIYEHIKQYHNGQEVVVEVPEEEIQEDLKAYQENSDAKLSTVDAEPTSQPLIENHETSLVPAKEEIVSPKSSNQGLEKKKNETAGFTSAGASDDLVYTRTFKKVKEDTGERWVQIQSDKKKVYQFVRDEDKYTRLMAELQNNTSIHPELKLPVKKLFENPKINVVEITNQPNSPYLNHKIINFKNPMPMFIVDRETSNGPEMLGGIASYIMAAKDGNSLNCSVEDSKVIGVMKVILASDKELTVENIVFNDKPNNPDMVPVLEEVKNPDIPLLKNSKILKWKCNKCLAMTWKFPLHKETHFCNACPICHKTFISPVSLKKHLVLHKRDGTRYCKECQAAFVSKLTLNSHLNVHITHILCDKCHLFVLREKEEEHKEIHTKDPSEQFPCSVCKKVFGSGQDLKHHETKLCSKLVARFNCSLCDKKFFTLTALSYHSAAHKKAAIKYSCRFCPKIFIQEKEQCPKKEGKRKPSSYLQKIWHERIHTRDRPVLCKSCPKRFRSMPQEADHRVKVHNSPGTPPLRNVHVHMCTYCDRVFRSEKQLTTHMLQHTQAE